MGINVYESIGTCPQGDGSDWFEQSFVANLGDVLRSVGALTAREGLPPVDGTSRARDWDALIAHVRTAARGSGETEARLRQREVQAQNLLRSAHKRLDEATARMIEAEETVRAAEDRVRAAEALAAAMIEAAERRASRAEEAARSALDWLQRLRETGLAHLPDRPVPVPAPRALARVA